jgi:anti-sigma B factor antagonist
MVWSRRRTVDGVVILYVLPGMTPEHEDIECLAEALMPPAHIPRVVVELSDLDVISSALIARLAALSKRVRAVKGRLILCGLLPFVREAFFDSSLNSVFEILDDEEAALASL